MGNDGASKCGSSHSRSLAPAAMSSSHTGNEVSWSQFGAEAENEKARKAWLELMHMGGVACQVRF